MAPLTCLVQSLKERWRKSDWCHCRSSRFAPPIFCVQGQVLATASSLARSLCISRMLVTRRACGSFAVPTSISSAHTGHAAPLAWHAPRMYHMHKSCNNTCPPSRRRSPLVCVSAATEKSQQRKPANEDVEGSMLDPSLANKNTVRAPCGWFLCRMSSAVMTPPISVLYLSVELRCQGLTRGAHMLCLNCTGAPGGCGCSGAPDRQVFRILVGPGRKASCTLPSVQQAPFHYSACSELDRALTLA